MGNDHIGRSGIRDKTAVVTGGGGALGGAMARALAAAGAKVAVLGLRPEPCGATAEAIRRAQGEAIAISCDVRDHVTLERARAEIHDVFGPVDILVNVAGGNRPDATVSPDRPFFDLAPEAIDEVIALNLGGTIQSCQTFGRDLASRGEGCIVNIASMSATRPLTQVVAYSAAKAAVVNFTQWLAVYMAREHSPRIRVNAIAPGFFLTAQNHYLLIDGNAGGVTERGQAILDHTPAGRLGEPDDVTGALLWLVSPAAAFVTGAIIPVDGGFAAFSGV